MSIALQLHGLLYAHENLYAALVSQSQRGHFLEHVGACLEPVKDADADLLYRELLATTDEEAWLDKASTLRGVFSALLVNLLKHNIALLDAEMIAGAE